jgi:hypothetical protein
MNGSATPTQTPSLFAVCTVSRGIRPVRGYSGSPRVGSPYLNTWRATRSSAIERQQSMAALDRMHAADFGGYRDFESPGLVQLGGQGFLQRLTHEKG